MSLRDLIRDVLWARARVLIDGGWETRAAWRYVRFVRHEVAIPQDLARQARGHYRALTPRRPGANFHSCIDQHGPTAPLVHYIVVRADLPTGSQVAQTIHAAGESAAPKPEPGCVAIALHARDEHHLLEIASSLAHAKIPHHLVVEADAPYADQYMAIGVHPTRDRQAVRKVLSALPLVK